ncbi:MAG: helix-turn-helix domain-containing protein [Chitinivibrionales bacterium]|nr:helix-turn-helix domain-containing protein [Chitinivibrionales bacterium]
MARISKDQLLKLQKKYRTDRAIGELYGISRQAVHRLRKRYGISPAEQRRDRRDEDVVRLYAAGQSATRIAQRFHLSTVHVYRILRRHQVALRRPRPGNE